MPEGNKKTVLVFDKFFGYNVGGAQRSLHTLLRALPPSQFTLHGVGCVVGKEFAAADNSAPGVTVSARLPIRRLPRLPYLEYVLNRGAIKKFFSARTEDILITQGLWGALAARFFPGRSVLFVRDVYQLNYIPLYYKQRFKNIFKMLYLALQWPGLYALKHDTKKAMQRATVVANSAYMATEVKKRFGTVATVIYPPLTAADASQSPAHHTDGYITLVGDEKMKGRVIVERLAHKLPNEKFLIIGRSIRNEYQRANIVYRPWQRTTSFYEHTKIILFPSIWPEGFGRVALEAMVRGIPAIGTDRGGLTEVLPTELRIRDPWNLPSWESAINLVEREYDAMSKKVKHTAEPFVRANPSGQFLQLINSLV